MSHIQCFRCHLSCDSLAELLEHFKKFHKMKEFEPIPCTFDSCKRSFTNRRWFVDHFKKVHAKPLNVDHSNSDDTPSAYFPSPVNIPQQAEPCVLSGTSSSNQNPPESDDDSNCSIIENYNFGKDSVKMSLEDTISDFCLFMHSHLAIPFSFGNETVNCVMNLVASVNTLYENKLTQLLANDSNGISENALSEMKKEFDWVNCKFESFKTTYRVKKVFEDMGLYIPPVPKFIGFTKVTKIVKAKIKFRKIRVKGTSVLIPLRKVLKVLFQQEGVLQSVMKYLHDLDCGDDVLTNFVHGQCWRDTTVKDSGITLPFGLFNDCIELGNALSGHSGINKVNASYFFIPCFPPEVRSSLSYMFVAFLTKSSNLKYFALKRVFQPLIDELNYLSESGISVEMGGMEVRLFFKFCCLCGDNLGLNTLGGFVQNFSSANFCCRICLADRETRKMMTREKPHLLRTKNDYRTHVNCKNPSSTGIHEECPFNGVGDFFILNNGLVDVMHDIYEGLAQYDLGFILHHYMYCAEPPLFTLATFNSRLQNFDYGSFDFSNKPPPLPQTFKTKKKLRMSASETNCLMKNLGLLIGDLIPPDDPVWELYIALRRLVDLVMSPSFSKNWCELLALYIEEHHLLYIVLTRKALPFKFHNVTHYPRLMVHFGPLYFLSGMRGENKNRVIKTVSNSVATHKNICLTIGTKCAMQLCRDFYNHKFRKTEFKTGPNERKRGRDGLFEEFNDLPFTTEVPQILKNKQTFRTPWVELHGTKYSVGSTLYLTVDEESSLPIFGYVKNIFVSSTGDVYFLLKNFQTINFDERFYAFGVESVESYSIFRSDQIHQYHPLHAVSLPSCITQYVTLISNT